MGPEYLYLILFGVSSLAGLAVCLFWWTKFGQMAAVLGVGSVSAALVPFLIEGANVLSILYWGMFGVAVLSSICVLAAGLMKTAVAVALFGGSFLLDQTLPNNSSFSLLKLLPQASTFFAPLLAPTLILPAVFHATRRRTETMGHR